MVNLMIVMIVHSNPIEFDSVDPNPLIVIILISANILHPEPEADVRCEMIMKIKNKIKIS